MRSITKLSLLITKLTTFRMAWVSKCGNTGEYACVQQALPCFWKSRARDSTEAHATPPSHWLRKDEWGGAGWWSWCSWPMTSLPAPPKRPLSIIDRSRLRELDSRGSLGKATNPWIWTQSRSANERTAYLLLQKVRMRAFYPKSSLISQCFWGNIFLRADMLLC